MTFEIAQLKLHLEFESLWSRQEVESPQCPKINSEANLLIFRRSQNHFSQAAQHLLNLILKSIEVTSETCEFALWPQSSDQLHQLCQKHQPKGLLFLDFPDQSIEVIPKNRKTLAQCKIPHASIHHPEHLLKYPQEKIKTWQILQNFKENLDQKIYF